MFVKTVFIFFFSRNHWRRWLVRECVYCKCTTQMNTSNFILISNNSNGHLLCKLRDIMILRGKTGKCELFYICCEILQSFNVKIIYKIYIHHYVFHWNWTSNCFVEKGKSNGSEREKLCYELGQNMIKGMLNNAK